MLVRFVTGLLFLLGVLWWLGPMGALVEEPVSALPSVSVPADNEEAHLRFDDLPYPGSEPYTPRVVQVAEKTAPARPILYVDGGRVHMRAGPSSRYQVLGSLRRGTPVELLDDTHPAYFKVRTTFQRAPVWMSRAYLTETAG